MSNHEIFKCINCDTKNRVPLGRLSAAKCGKCHKPLQREEIALRTKLKRSLKTNKYVIKGTKYYQAGPLVKTGSLCEGNPVHLVSEPENQYDRFAVSVQTIKGDKLGHLSKKVAPKFQHLIRVGHIEQAKIKRILTSIDGCRIELEIKYREEYQEKKWDPIRGQISQLQGVFMKSRLG